MPSDQSKVGQPDERTEKQFGYLISVFFAVPGLLSVLQENVPNLTWFIISICTALVALFYPQVLRTPTKIWIELGEVLHFFVNPVIMGMIFFLVVTPIGWLMKFAGADLLCLKWEPGQSTYWKVKEPKGPPRETMKNQY